ncbi:hypothetical protein SNE40_015073 [Patella caerulea]|uniref:dolichyl-P-Man:Man5GlcNAc2-PP-dolichol alpha-1,3-mannosyltransferase n=1 Tax=Patella caerulea TaxID=87958 RepID=A0AAN8JG81_PATCE
MAASMKRIPEENKSSRFSIYRLQKFVFDPNYAKPVMLLLLLAELVVNLIVIHKIKYTEIDWKAYMQEVEGVVNGTYDYLKLKGDTGPLVYPAGFVYIYTALYYITDHGTNIRLAQYIFACLYMLTLLIVFDIYRYARRVPPYVFFFMCCASYRIHSIFILRLFNDPVAMIFMYLAIDLFLRQHWTIGCFMYSLGVSIKMNLLLFSPAVFILLMVSQGTLGTIKHLIVCALPQVALAIPFLKANPIGYLLRSFDFGRQFFYIWTVNWRLVPEEIFLNRNFQLALLAAHVLVLLIFIFFRFKRLYPDVCKSLWMKPSCKRLNANQIVLPLFTSNFIGMCFSRSLHYQFYIWYFHGLHYLLWATPIPTVLKVLILGVIELSWNTYPSTILSSSLLHGCHAILLLGLWFSSSFDEKAKEEPKKAK